MSSTRHANCAELIPNIGDPLEFIWRNLLRAGIAAYLSAILGRCRGDPVVCAPLAGRVNNTTAALAMLLVVLVVASVWGSRPALLASTLGALAFDYYFLPPVGSFAIGDTPGLGCLWCILFVTAVTVGGLSARAKQRATEAERGSKQAQRAGAYNWRFIEASPRPAGHHRTRRQADRRERSHDGGHRTRPGRAHWYLFLRLFRRPGAGSSRI